MAMHSKRWLVLAIVSMALLLIVVDMTVLYTALPTLTHDLAASTSMKLWIVNAYALVVAGLLLSTGALGDRLGYRRMFMLGLVIFGAASLAAAYAPNAGLLIAARAVLGLGAAIMMPATLAIIRMSFPDQRERSVAIGIWASVASGGAALGPVVGGVLLQYFWWGSVFLVNVPIVALALVLTAWLIPADRLSTKASLPGWDYTSSLQAMVAMVSLVLGIKELAKPAPSLVFAVLMGLLSAAVLWIFIRRQLSRPQPLIELRLFRIPTFSGGVVAAVVAAVALVGVELVFSQRLQLVLGLSPLQAGLAILPIPVAAFVAGPIAGWALSRLGTHQLIVGGLLVTAVALCALAMSLNSDAHGLQKIAVLAVLGLGVGATITAASNAVMNSAPPEHAGMAASVEEVSYEFGGVLGVALLGSVLSWRYTSSLVLPDILHGAAGGASDGIDAALLAAEKLPPQAATQLLGLAHAAFDQGFIAVMATAVVLVLTAALAVALLRSRGQQQATLGHRSGAVASKGH
ncbi:MFS transporter [Comamonas sp.]|uniref:MFS transporter n=1 Tax=Comamonas sp. TaxID=34028 RepID=UPI003D0C2432